MKDFSQLISNIEQVHKNLQATAATAVNKALTIRNWLIGYYIVEFEQNGSDRAQYGSQVLKELGTALLNIKGMDERALRKYRQFYILYPQLIDPIRGALTTISTSDSKWGSLTAISEIPALPVEIEELSQPVNKLQVPAEVLISKLSYTHFEQLFSLDEPLKRTFYELECIKGIWSVRELKRQINSLYFERSGLTKDPEKLAELVQQKTFPQEPKDIIKNIYAFEFLDISTLAIVEESDLETALLDHYNNSL